MHSTILFEKEICAQDPFMRIKSKPTFASVYKCIYASIGKTANLNTPNTFTAPRNIPGNFRLLRHSSEQRKSQCHRFLATLKEEKAVGPGCQLRGFMLSLFDSNNLVSPGSDILTAFSSVLSLTTSASRRFSRIFILPSRSCVKFSISDSQVSTFWTIFYSKYSWRLTILCSISFLGWLQVCQYYSRFFGIEVAVLLLIFASIVNWYHFELNLEQIWFIWSSLVSLGFI